MRKISLALLVSLVCVMAPSVRADTVIATGLSTSALGVEGNSWSQAFRLIPNIALVNASGQPVGSWFNQSINSIAVQMPTGTFFSPGPRLVREVTINGVIEPIGEITPANWQPDYAHSTMTGTGLDGAEYQLFSAKSNSTALDAGIDFTLHFAGDMDKPLTFDLFAFYNTSSSTSWYTPASALGKPSTFLWYTASWTPDSNLVGDGYWVVRGTVVNGTIADFTTLAAVPVPATAGMSLALLAVVGLFGGMRRFTKKA